MPEYDEKFPDAANTQLNVVYDTKCVFQHKNTAQACAVAVANEAGVHAVTNGTGHIDCIAEFSRVSTAVRGGIVVLQLVRQGAIEVSEEVA